MSKIKQNLVYFTTIKDQEVIINFFRDALKKEKGFFSIFEPPSGQILLLDDF